MTSKENQLAKDMVDLIKNIEEHTGRLSSGERIPQMELEIIVSKIKSLYEKSVILKYLHAHIDDIQNTAIIETCPEVMPGNEVQPLVEAQVAHGEIITEKKSIHEKIISSKTPKTLVEKLQEKSLKNLSSAIALHEKLMFQKELFGGNNKDYNDMIQGIESQQNFREAKKYLEENFYDKYSWEKKSEILNVLLGILENRFKGE